jgi:ferric-dicitrate binding protein FerR (iron transport regulator)
LTITDYRVGNGGQSRDATLSLGEGLLRAAVSALNGPPHFEVDTATGVAAVRSTDWFIEAQPGSTKVGVLEGRVSLKSVATGKEIVIPAHWGARVEAGRDPVPARVQGSGPGKGMDRGRIRQSHPAAINQVPAKEFPLSALAATIRRGERGHRGDDCGAPVAVERPDRDRLTSLPVGHSTSGDPSRL